MDSRAEELAKQGDGLFASRANEMTRWQEIAENFYPERADFQSAISGSAADNLFNSYPILARRELGNSIASNLRPRQTRWFSIHVDDEALDNGAEERRYLEYLTGVMWRAMYDPVADFVGATKQADHDYVSFGNAAIELCQNWQVPALLYRNHHLRDVAWSENANRVIDVVHRNIKLTARQLTEMFGDKVSKDVREAMKTEPDKTFSCRHIVVPERVYRPDGTDMKRRRKTAFTSFYIETDTKTVLEEVGQNTLHYIIPRWHILSDSPYARSLATEVALPDARALQAVARTMQEAGEKYVDPPMIAYREALRSDLALYAGGVTFADVDYDEKTGEILRPVVGNPGAMPIGRELALDLRDDIRKGFFLDKLTLPQIEGKMTAFEIQKRIEEHIRSAAPLFEPKEQQYSAPLCMETFDQLLEGGAFGPKENMPKTLAGREIRFTFQSPLREVSDEAMTGQFLEGLKVLQTSAAFDQAQLAGIDYDEATRDALRGVRWPAKWFKPVKAIADARQQIQAAQKMQKGAEALGSGAEVAKTVGEAAQSWKDAGLSVPGVG